MKFLHERESILGQEHDPFLGLVQQGPPKCTRQFAEFEGHAHLVQDCLSARHIANYQGMVLLAHQSVCGLMEEFLAKSSKKGHAESLSLSLSLSL